MAKLIVSIDQSLDAESLILLLKEIHSGGADGIKINTTSLMNSTFAVIADAEFWQAPFLPEDILLDLKIADIGLDQSGTNAKIIKEVDYYFPAVSHVTAHAFTGEYSIKEACSSSEHIKTLLVVGMTHPRADEFMTEEFTMRAVDYAEKYNAWGLIAPGNRLDLLRKVRNKTDKPIWSPGFGRQSDINIKEHIEEFLSIVGPSEENAIIMGSSIVEDSDDPETETAKIKNILEGNL